MPAKNVYHDAVRAALEADGWTITDDPLFLSYGRRLYVDLGAERAALAAEREGERIAVEVQSFVSDSNVESFHHAVGQYVVYRELLAVLQPDRTLYLAVPESVYDGVMTEPLGSLVVRRVGIRLLVFSPSESRVVQWTN